MYVHRWQKDYHDRLLTRLPSRPFKLLIRVFGRQ